MNLNSKPFKIAIFASGSGTNADNLMRYFKHHPQIEVAVVICNVSGAGVIEKAERQGVPCEIIGNQQAADGPFLLKCLEKFRVTHLVLAGYLRLIPKELIQNFEGKIINIHPSLLPHYGGKGMFGMRVHESVIAHQELESGISIHEVNEEFDKGRILFQARIRIEPNETAETLAQRIHELEYRHFPEVVSGWIEDGV